MSKLLQHRFFFRENIVLLIGVSLCVYFAYHGIQGNRSVIRMISLNASVTQAEKDYTDLNAQRVAIETKVKAMRPGSISRDLLEQRAREILGYRHPDEIVIKGE